MESCQDVQPGHNGPQAVFFTDVVRASSETLFTADAQLFSVKQGTEKLPASRDFIDIQSLVLSHKVNGTRSGHGTSQAVDTVFLEVRNVVTVFSDDSDRVSRRNKGPGTVDHVSVAVTVGSGTKCNILLVDPVNQSTGVGQVGVWVQATKIGLWHVVLNGVFRQAQFVDEDLVSVGTCDSVQGIEQDFESIGFGRLDKRLDERKVKDILQHVDVVFGGVDDFDLQPVQVDGADLRQICRGQLFQFVAGKLLGNLEDLVGDGLGSRPAVFQVVLDPHVVLGSAGVVGRCQDDAASCAPDSDDMGRRWGRQNAVLANDELGNSVCSGDLHDQLDHMVVVVAAVAANDQS